MVVVVLLLLSLVRIHRVLGRCFEEHARLIVRTLMTDSLTHSRTHALTRSLTQPQAVEREL